MFARETNPVELWVEQATEAFEFWAGFWPTAPLFGVEWRFAEAVRKMTPTVEFEAVVVEPVEAEAAEPADVAEVAPAADDLTVLKGIGPGLAGQLNAQGITSLAQMAALSEAELAAVDAKLTSFKGRCFRDDWVGQARALIT